MLWDPLPPVGQLSSFVQSSENVNLVAQRKMYQYYENEGQDQYHTLIQQLLLIFLRTIYQMYYHDDAIVHNNTHMAIVKSQHMNAFMFIYWQKSELNFID